LALAEIGMHDIRKVGTKLTGKSMQPIDKLRKLIMNKTEYLIFLL